MPDSSTSLEKKELNVKWKVTTEAKSALRESLGRLCRRASDQTNFSNGLDPDLGSSQLI